MAVIEKDIIDLICKELFTVKFLHNAYEPLRKSSIAENIDIEPDQATKNLFNNHSLGYRLVNDTLICFIRTELLSPPGPDPKSPYIKFDGTVLIRFLVKASTDFFKKTNVVSTGARQVYQFGNQVNAAVGGFICMHTTGVNNDDLKDTGIVIPEKPCFGVIDIVSSGAVNASYEIFSGGTAQLLRSPAYSIQFISTI
jgi:hypothetical protein